MGGAGGGVGAPILPPPHSPFTIQHFPEGTSTARLHPSLLTLLSSPLTLQLHTPATIPALPFLQCAVLTPTLGLLMSCDSGGEKVMDVKRRDLLPISALMAVVVIIADGSLRARLTPQ